MKAFAASLSDADLRAPSLLPGWSVGHVLTHLAQNADAFARAADEVAAGRPGVMYPGGFAARSAAIEAGSARGGDELRAHLDASALAFEARWPATGEAHPDAPCATVPGGPAFPAGEVPLRRRREVEVHLADCGGACTPAQWPDDYVDADLPGQLALVPARLTGSVHVVDDRGVHHLLGDGAEQLPAVEVARWALLAWCFSRLQPDGLPALAEWGR